MSIIFLLLLIVFGIWVLQASKWSISTALAIILATLLIVIIGVLFTKPFVFNGKDANNIILFGTYLLIAGALFTVHIDAFKEQIFAGKMPVIVKKILIYYLVYSILLLILITFEAVKLRS